MDYKEIWCEIYAEMKEELGHDPAGIDVDQALADQLYDYADCLNDVMRDEEMSK